MNIWWKFSGEMERTSPLSPASRASLMTCLIASQAQLILPLDHGSGSNFLRGAYIVGHSDDFNFSEVIVSAAVFGTVTTYGGGSGILSGNVGGRGCSRVMQSTMLIVASILRIRLR